MNKKIKGILFVVLSVIMALSIAGCAAISGVKTPQDAIKDAYGDEQFKISFYAGTLEEPIADMYYSANDMPTLPTPEKVGYIFAGWFFDSSLTDPCDVSDGDLYWKMCDVTLYAAWNKEAIVNNGTYDIEFEAEIVESSVAKGILADKYGWYKFPEDIVESETYIEKNDSGTFLRIQYDCHERGPIFGDGTGTFERQTYMVEDGGTGRISEELSVLDRTSTIQTIYYDISDLDLADTITLNISYYNWGAELEEGENREQCSVGYTIEFRITRFIGFTQSFVNPEGKLDDGIYLVPTHYTGLDKSGAMLDSFHPVYSYIIAENGRYTLIKQLSAYNSDILGNLEGDDYFNRTTGYARDFTYFLTDADNVLTAEQAEDNTLFVPALFDAKEYGTLTYEFHADTGKYYYTFDLGDTLDQDIILFGGSTGAMEQMFNFPFSYRRLCINYDSIVRITDWDYTQLSGDSYTYRNEAPYYAGYIANDFADDNTIYNLLKNYSYAVRMVNMFFASTDGGETGEKNFDTKMTVAPTAQTVAAGNIADSRYKMAYFDLTYQAFGYNVLDDGELYSSAISYLALSVLGMTNSDIAAVDIGKTLTIGTSVDLLELYMEKVYPTVTESNLNWKAYRLNSSGNVQFSSPISLSRNFIFQEGVAILFSAKYDDGTRTCLVTLMPEEEPTYKIQDTKWTYDEEEGVWVTSERFKVDSYADVPEITYKWLGWSYSTYSLIKYEDDEHTPKTNYLQVAAWEYNNGVYQRLYEDFTDGYELSNVLEMTSAKIRLTFRLVNRFGEYETIILEYRGESVGDYSLTENGETIQSGELTYTDDKRDPIEYEAIMSYIVENESDIASIPQSFGMRITDSDVTSQVNIDFKFATIYLRDSSYTIYSLSELWEKLKDEPYALVYLTYESEYGDTAKCRVLYNFTIDAESIGNYVFVDGGTDLFTGEVMEFERPKIASSEYKQFARGSLNVYRLSGNNYVNAGKDYVTKNESNFGTEVAFLQEGTYLLVWSFSFETDFDGNPVFGQIVGEDGFTAYARLGQEIAVHDENSDITVTYVTDKEHPFNQSQLNSGRITEDEQYQYYSITVSMSEINNTPDYYDFILENNDSLYGWGTSWNIEDRMFTAGNSIGKLGLELHTLTPMLYALWDKGVTVTAYYDMDGQTNKILGTQTYYRPVYGGSYTLNLFDFRRYYEFPDGYEIVGWRADAPIFYEGYGSSAVYSDTTDAEFDRSWNINESCTIWLVVKKVMNISYQAIDEDGKIADEEGNPYGFDPNISVSRDILEDSILSETITEAKLNQLENPICTDSTKEFKYWAVMVDGELTEFDIYSDELKAEYISSGNTIVLYAVFGDKEAAV